MAARLSTRILRLAPRVVAAALLAAFAPLAAPPAAYAQYFGKNKVHYKDFEWEIIKTQHFEVFFYPKERQTAIDAARMAERAYARLSKVLGYEMARPVPLILYASHTDFQQTNISSDLISEGTGGVTEFLKRRVFLPFTGSYAELEHVLTHELVHAFQVEILFGTGGSVLANPVAFQPPLWFMEGMAEYLSIGGTDVHTQMWLRDASLQGYLTPLPVLGQVGDIRVYRFGQSIFHFIGAKFGEEKIGEVLKSAARLGSVGSAFKSVLGMPLEELSDAWLEEVRKDYLPQITNYEKPSKFARRLTKHGEDLSDLNLVPALSPDGEQVAFISDRSLYSDLYLADATTGEVKDRLVKGERTGNFESLRFFNTSMAWSADGKFLTFPAKVGGEDAIYIFEMESKKVRHKLTFGLDGILSPAFSPDGQEIVFVGLDGGQSDLFVTDLSGKNLRRLTSDRFTDRDPQFSPDGKQIAFTTDRGEATNFEELTFGNYALAILDLETNQVSVLPNQSGKNIAPQWSPNGDEILFVSDRTGISNLYSIDLKSGDVYKLTNILTGITGIIASASPISLARDGSRVVFSAFDRAGWDLYSIEDPFSLKQEPLRGEDTVVSAESADGADLAVAADSADATASPSTTTTTVSGADSVAVAATAPESGLVVAEAPAETDPLIARDTARPEPGPTRDTRVIDIAGLYPEADRPVPNPDMVAASTGYTLPDTSSFEMRRYKIRFTQDYLAGGAAFASNIGFAGQTALAFSDILGNHSLYVAANVFGSLSDSELLFAYQNLKDRLNYGIALFQYRNDYFVFTSDEDTDFQTQVFRGAEVSFSYPFSKFRRVEFGLEGVSVSENLYDQIVYVGYDRPDPEDTDHLFYAKPSLSLVHDNVLYGNTGPIHGARSRISIDRALGDLQFTTGVVDMRKYFNIRHRYSVAVRMLGGYSDGRDPQLFRIGGGYTFRGADYGDLRGTRIGLANIEFRYPLIDRLQLGFPPLDFRGIGGVFFFDLGSAWVGRDFRFFDEAANGKRRLGDVQGAYGFGARVNLGYFILRYDIAQRTDLHENLGKIDFFTLSADF
ncbi:MAG: DPP IV N-terminal domain-containing protein [bacterium]